MKNYAGDVKSGRLKVGIDLEHEDSAVLEYVPENESEWKTLLEKKEIGDQDLVNKFRELARNYGIQHVSDADGFVIERISGTKFFGGQFILPVKYYRLKENTGKPEESDS